MSVDEIMEEVNKLPPDEFQEVQDALTVADQIPDDTWDTMSVENFGRILRKRLFPHQMQALLKGLAE